MAAKFEIQVAKDGEFYFHLKSEGGDILLSSEMYKAKASAQKGIASVKANLAVEGHFERKTSVKAQPYYVLKAGNGEVIGQSKMFQSAAEMEAGIAAVRQSAPAADTVDLSPRRGR